jgi:hypothetical protein
VKITISGASGLIGRRLLKNLTAEGHTLQVLSRHAGTNMPGNIKVFPWDPRNAEPPAEALRDTDAVIHLAGEPVAQRWNDEVKRKIRESRIAGTANLVNALARLPNRPKTLVCASAIGYYGSRGDEILTEASTPGSDYLAGVCVEWEKAAQAAEPFGVRVVRVRTGVLLDAKGGALAKMLPPFKMGVGGKVGSGQQWMSWIHAEDLAGIFSWALTGTASGPVNGVAPNPVINADFTKALASTLKRPALFPVPAFGLKVLFGEMSEVLLGSQRVLPKAAEAGGYRFRFPEVGAALADVLR